MQQAAMRAREIETYSVREGVILTDLPALAQKVATLFDGTRTPEQVFAAAQISVAKGEAIVRKLTELSILLPLDGYQAVTSMSSQAPLSELESSRTLRIGTRSGFSAFEEAFFDSEVQDAEEVEAYQGTLGERIGVFFSRLFLGMKGSPA
jgi:hypothetical protein